VVKNIGETDQVVRLMLACILLILAVGLGDWFWVLVIPAGLLVATATTRRSLLYALFGWSTADADVTLHETKVHGQQSRL